MRQLPQLFLLFAGLFFAANLFGQDDDRSLSPYFFVQSDSGSTDQMPLKSTGANVSIAGVIADVEVSQVYENTGKNTLEAIYVFPASSRAAVYAMTMKIGDRTIEAKIHEKQKAREAYAKAKAEGKSASLLEQERPNVFKMNVANIKPGAIIKVTMKYTELLIPENGVYEFAYPTVVGPRYTGGAPLTASAAGTTQIAPVNSGFAAQPYSKAGIAPTYDWDMELRIAAGMPIRDITSGTHNVGIHYDGLTSASISLDAAEKKSGNKDFVLQYRLAGDGIESGLLLYEHGDENFFLAVIQPPKAVAPKNIPPREYIFVVDVSGSMGGWPLNISKKLLRNLIVNLRPEDKFNVMVFSGSTGAMAPASIPATEENIEKAVNTIDNQRGGGGTRLLLALKDAMALPPAEGMARSFVVVTDGYVSVEQEAFEYIRQNLDQANMFAFGIGSSVNRHLIEGIAHVGMSEPLIITSDDGSDEAAEKFRKYIQSPVLTQIKVNYSGFDAYDVEPISVPDVLAERPVIIYGKYKGSAAGKIKLVGHSGNGKYIKSFNVAEYKSSKKNNALRYLWARKRIALLDDFSQFGRTQAHIDEITQIGLSYNLMTAYTSFLAVDHTVSDPSGNPVTVNQPLPMPAHVSNSSVGFDVALQGVTRRSKKSCQKIVTGKIIMDGTDEMKEDLELMIQQKLSDLNKELVAAGKLSTGNIKLRITVDASGSIIKVEVVNSSVDEDTEKWILEEVSSWNMIGLNINPEIVFELPISIKS